MDSIYFRGEQTSLKLKNKVFVGQFEPLDNITQYYYELRYANKTYAIASKKSLSV